MLNTDEFVIEICRQVAGRMTATGLLGTELRERSQLDPFVKDAFGDATGIRPVGKKFASKSFRGLGAVDVVLDRPRLFMELKWSYQRPGKVFESVWDAIKLAILGPEHGRTQLYIATGASEEEWGRSECADLFVSGVLDPLDMWQRPLVPRRGPNYGESVGEDLVIGGNGNQPTHGPRGIAVRFLESFPVAADFELRLIGIDGTTDLRPWPQIHRAIAGRSPGVQQGEIERRRAKREITEVERDREIIAMVATRRRAEGKPWTDEMEARMLAERAERRRTND